eukprot:tig00001384_g8557.t1
MAASSERPSKRAKEEVEDGLPSPAAAIVQEATELSLERLPGGLLSRILQFLSLKEAFCVREVSRALSDAVEGTAFDGAKLDLDAMRTEALDSLERLVREGRLNGSELSVSVLCEWKPSSGGGRAEQQLRQLAALAGRCRSVRVNFAYSHGAERLLQGDAGDQIFGQRVADVLAALAPGGAASPLQELELELHSSGSVQDHELLISIPGAVLEIPAALLAPLAGLRSLLLPDLPLSAGTAAAIAARLPALRCLQLCYTAERPGVLGRLGLLRLDRLVLRLGPRGRLQGNMRLDEIAGTPLARSLRELHVEDVDPWRKGYARPVVPGLSADDLGALAGMPQLEAVTGYVVLMDNHGGALGRRLRSLLRAPRLSVLQLSLLGLGTDPSTAFIAALAAGPLPTHLALDLRVPGPEIAEMVNAGAGPILRSVNVSMVGAPADAVASVSAALLNCPRLERLVLRLRVRSAEDIATLAAGLAPLAALPPLPGGLRLEVIFDYRLEELTARAEESFFAALPAATLNIQLAHFA